MSARASVIVIVKQLCAHAPLRPGHTTAKFYLSDLFSTKMKCSKNKPAMHIYKNIWYRGYRDQSLVMPVQLIAQSLHHNFCNRWI